MRRLRGATLTVAVLALAACGGQEAPSIGGGPGSGTGNGTGSALDEASWRVVSDGPGGPPDGHEAATAAVEPDDLAEQWVAYGAEGSPDDLADGEVAILLGFGESGSCPEEVREVRVDADAGEVLVDREIEGGPGQACTDDYNPRTIVLAVDGEVLPDGPFLLATSATQRTYWHGVAPHGASQPPADHPHLGLGYGQDEPVATLEAEPRQVPVGEHVELVVTAAAAEDDPAVGDGTAPDPHDELALQDLEAADQLDEAQPLVPATLDAWDTYRWVATQDEAERHEGHPAVERVAFGEIDSAESASAATVATATLEPGWYRVTIQVLGLGQRGPADVSAQFQVTD
jgi:hypothetical protein